MNHSDDTKSLRRAASDQESAPRFHEVYEIVSTVELVHDMSVYRIEILKSYHDTKDRYSSRVYAIQSSTRAHLPIPIDTGDVHEDSLDGALSRTIGFLRRTTHARSS